MATRGQPELTKSERRAREAIGGFEDGQIWRLGDFKTTITGGSIQATIANEFCARHGIEKGDSLAAFMDTGTGALVIIPENNGNGDE